ANLGRHRAGLDSFEEVWLATTGEVEKVVIGTAVAVGGAAVKQAGDTATGEIDETEGIVEACGRRALTDIALGEGVARAVDTEQRPCVADVQKIRRTIAVDRT